MNILETERLILRQINTDDAEFMLSLLNEPDWIKYIGDRGIQTVEAAKQYIQDGPMTMYEEHGIGLYLVELKESETPIGICGLIQRDFLKDVDLGFAIGSKYWGCGYAFEAANATLTYGTILGKRSYFSELHSNISHCLVIYSKQSNVFGCRSKLNITFFYHSQF